MKAVRKPNSDSRIASNEELAIFRRKCLENSELMKYYISLEDEKNWLKFRNRINQLLQKNRAAYPAVKIT